MPNLLTILSTYMWIIFAHAYLTTFTFTCAKKYKTENVTAMVRSNQYVFKPVKELHVCVSNSTSIIALQSLSKRLETEQSILRSI